MTDLNEMAENAKKCEKALLKAMRGVNRVEVIDENGRSYTKYLKDNEGIKYSLQDDNRTLKVFIDKQRWKEDL